MAAITDLSDLINRYTGGASGTPETIWWHKIPRIAGAATVATITDREHSLWRYDGAPSAGIAPTTVAIPDNTTAGGLKQTDPGGGRQKWLTSTYASATSAGMLIMYDRLLHIGGLSGTVASPTAQTVGGTLTRYTNGLGNFAFAEMYTIIGPTGTTIRMSYTNQSAASGQLSPLVPIGATGFREVNRLIRLPLAAGDNGIQAIASVTLTASTGTAGDFGITIGHPLATMTLGGAGIGGWRDFTTGFPGLPEILPDACLAFIWVASTTTAPEMRGCVGMVEA